MQQDKFDAAERLFGESASTSTTASVTPASPKHLRKDSDAYWKAKLLSLQEASAQPRKCSQEVVLNEVPGLLTVERIPTNREKKKQVRVTQICGSMTARDVISTVKDVQEKKDDVLKAKDKRMSDKLEREKVFLVCQSKCTCKKNACNASGLKQCPVCKDVMKSACRKKTCCSESKPVIISVEYNILKKSRTR